MVYRSRIAGTGSYLPEKLRTNKDIEAVCDTSDDWIRERTGIESRHIAAEDQATSDLAYEASVRAIEASGIPASEIDMILVATLSPDHVMPNTACLLQQRLQTKPGMAVDLSAACSGFVYALSIADLFIKNGQVQNVLVVGAEVLHRWVNPVDRNTVILFGDGAGAAVVSRSSEDQDSLIYSHHLHAEGNLSYLLEIEASGTRRMIDKEALDKGLNYVTMQGREIFKHAVRTMSKCCSEALEFNKMNPEDIDWLIPHQANVRIIEAVAKHFSFPMEKVVVEIADVGNTSAATVPIALDRTVRSGRLKRGQNALLTAFGGGLTSGSLLLKY